MANPRNKIAFNQIDNTRITFRADGTSITYDPLQPNGSAAVGKAVRMVGQGVVGLTVDASIVVGQLLSVEKDLACVVIVDGVLSLPGAGVINAGDAIVGSLDAGTNPGAVRAAAAAGGAYAQAAATDARNSRGVVLDSSTLATTFVWY